MAKFDELDLEETLPDGRKKYQLLKSGAVKDVQTNKFVARRITSEQGREMINSRWEKHRQANASAILKEARAIDPSIKTEAEALAMAAGKTFLAILDSEKPRGDDLLKLSQLTGAHPTLADARMRVETPSDNPALDEAMQGLLNAMLDKLKGREDANVIDAEFAEGE